MPQTREDRMYLHYKSLVDKRDYGTLWIQMARVWGMPCRSVKQIIQEYKEDRRRARSRI
jgi:hypothetical protein